MDSITLTVDELCQQLDNYIDGTIGLTISGGEPLDQYEELFELLSVLNRCRANTFRFNHRRSESKRDIWLYTGYDMENIIHDNRFTNLLSQIDVMITGKFNEKYSPTEYMGSSNQEMWITCNPGGTRWRRIQSKTYDNWFDPEYKTIDKV
jgi:organic radical activating enzyme